MPGTLTGLAVTAGRLNADAALDRAGTRADAHAHARPAPTPTPVAAGRDAVPAAGARATPPAATPTATPVPPVGAVVKSLSVKGKVSRRVKRAPSPTASPRARGSVTVRRTGCSGIKSCASSTSRWSEAAKAGTRTFTLGRRVAGRTLPPGKYTLTVATTSGRARSPSACVRTFKLLGS